MMASPDTELALGVLDALNDSQLLPNDIAAATGTTASEASDWLARRSNPPREHIERLAELASLLDRLSHVMSLQYIPKWISEQNPALKGVRPIDCLATGDYVVVKRLISGIEDPGAS
jgi:hypothetical protein